MQTINLTDKNSQAKGLPATIEEINRTFDDTNIIQERYSSTTDKNLNLESLYYVDITTGLRDVINKTPAMQALLSYPRNYSYITRGRSLDNISYNLYNTTDLWEFLAEYNNIVNPYEVPDYINIVPLNAILDILNANI